jgi:4'-phosphopantetheinyl transferase
MNWRELIGGRKRVPRLEPRCVHVWQISTAMIPADMEKLAEVLSPDEHDRAERFHFERDRRTFSVCRAVLRRLLASYADCDGARIRFSYGPQGKPALTQPRLSELRFNVSHSGDLALVAFALRRDIGVDVELMRDGVDFAALAETSFSRAERAAVLARQPDNRASLFYEYWTCKEACIKADGKGLSVPLDGFSIVAMAQEPQWRKVALVSPNSLAPGMRIGILSVGNGYAGAVAALGPGWDVRLIDLSVTPPTASLACLSQ